MSKEAEPARNYMDRSVEEQTQFEAEMVQRLNGLTLGLLKWGWILGSLILMIFLVFYYY